MIATLMKNKRIILEQSVLTVVIIYGLAAIARIFRSYYFEFIAGLNLAPGIDPVFLYLGHIWFLLAFVFFSWAVKDEAKYFFSGLKKKKLDACLAWSYYRIPDDGHLHHSCFGQRKHYR